MQYKHIIKYIMTLLLTYHYAQSKGNNMLVPSSYVQLICSVSAPEMRTANVGIQQLVHALAGSGEDVEIWELASDVNGPALDLKVNMGDDAYNQHFLHKQLG